MGFAIKAPQAFLLIALLAPGAATALCEQAPDAQFLLLDYRRVDETPEGRAKALADRCRLAAEWAIPRESSGLKPLNCSIEFSKDSPRFSAFTGKGGARIVIGGPLEGLEADSATLKSLMEALLLARAGIMPERAASGFPDWLSVGLARKAATAPTTANVPGRAAYPALLALSAAGAFPELKAIVETPLEPSDGACFALYAEACQALAGACGKAGMAQNGGFKAVVADAVANGSSDRWSSFLNALGPCLTPKKERDKSGKALKREDAQVSALASKWFKVELKSSLWSCFVPAPAKQIEAAFKEASVAAFKDKEGAERSCPLDELASRWSAVSDQRLLVAELRGRLAELSTIAPDELQLSLEKLQTALNGLLAYGSTPPPPDCLAPALSAFYASLEARIALEAKLKRIERASFPGSSRFAFSLGSLAVYDAWEEAPYPKASAYLDDCLAKSSK